MGSLCAPEWTGPGPLRQVALTGRWGLARYPVMVAYPEAAQRIGKLTPLADALATIGALARPVEPREVEIAAAAGRVLAAKVHAAAAQPAAPLALHDGWAVRSGETIDA